MKYSILSCFLMLVLHQVFAQVANSETNKIRKIVGEDFVTLKPKSNYPFGLHPETCSADTSTTFPDDTTGLVYNGEYVLFRDFIHFNKKKEQLSLMKPSSVTVDEYREFKEYVRDSIARLKLYYGLEEDNDAFNFLDSRGSNSEKYEQVTSGDRAIALDYYWLNWKPRLDYSGMRYRPILADMYYPVPERFRGNREFDERKFIYQYFDLFPTKKIRVNFQNRRDYFYYLNSEKAVVNYHTPISNHNTLWAEKAMYNDDEYGVLSQLYDEIDAGNPVVGLLGTQAKAFCNWKQRELQKKFEDNELGYQVIVTLPVPDQIGNSEVPYSLHVPSKDFSNQWRITKTEYSNFLDYVRDSVTRDVLHLHTESDKEAVKFINKVDYYFGEGYLEYMHFDPSERQLNREISTVNFKTKIKESHLNEKNVQRIFKKTNSFDDLMIYRYFTRRTVRAASHPLYEIGESGQFNAMMEFDYDAIRNLKSPLKRNTFENRDVKNEMGFGHGVRLLKKIKYYLHYKKIPVLLGGNALSGDPNSLIHSLSYEQALAYYNWKYPIDRFYPKEENWQQFIYPSEEQFKKIQNGESIVIPEHEVEFPTPLFRYVVHIYRK